MDYAAPGHADELAPELLARWNEAIEQCYANQHPSLKSRFFEIDPQRMTNAKRVTSVRWPGDPAEPSFCIDDATARVLSDWGVRGRHELHNEYCEYAVVYRRDAAGRLRPKRVEVTTELREFWSCVATHDPERLRSMATEVLGDQPSWQDLYGVADPLALSARRRAVAFGHTCAGHGNDRSMIEQGVPAQPTGPLNTERALFMTHPINGLDDLLYIVLFGAAPYAVGPERRPATREDIFVAFGVEHLACRHADPAAALGAYEAVLSGKVVAFADPLGMYLGDLNRGIFSYQGSALPEEWVRFGRGRDDLYQRLEFGPPDDHEAFLDDIVVSVGAADEPLTGGFQLVRHLEVGPVVLIGDTDPIADDEWRTLEPSGRDITCADADVCGSVRVLEASHAAENTPRTGLRER